MASGQELIDAIGNKQSLLGINNCTGVPARLSQALYGVAQSDLGSGTTVTTEMSSLGSAIGFGGSSEETAVWHFLMSPVHHFAVVPWKADGSQRFSVFMAYENQYLLSQYLVGDGSAPARGQAGNRVVWESLQFQGMLSDLANRVQGSWQTYFGQVGMLTPASITYWKYSNLKIDKAVANLAKY